jgi:hypothetical protein
MNIGSFTLGDGPLSVCSAFTLLFRLPDLEPPCVAFFDTSIRIFIVSSLPLISSLDFDLFDIGPSAYAFLANTLPRFYILSLIACFKPPIMTRFFATFSGGLLLRLPEDPPPPPLLRLDCFLLSSKITTFFRMTFPSRRSRSVRDSLLTSVPRRTLADLEALDR